MLTCTWTQACICARSRCERREPQLP